MIVFLALDSTDQRRNRNAFYLGSKVASECHYFIYYFKFNRVFIFIIVAAVDGKVVC